MSHPARQEDQRSATRVDRIKQGWLARFSTPATAIDL
jgi:hypothetical protein